MPNYFDQEDTVVNRKRQLDNKMDDELDAPLKKRYEQISDEFTNFNINSPIIEEIDDNAIDEELPTVSGTSSEEEDVLDCFVEEPDEGGQLVLSDSLLDYLKRMKHEKVFPIRSKDGKEIVFYNPADSIRSRIVEITEVDDDQLKEEENEPITESKSAVAASPVCLDEEEMIDNEEEEQMEID